ncbi:MAG TPA: hypothetical protein VH913_22755 [Hyphomicrobiaceae bacterium]|jgi:predicted metal-dependent HD superfamily phosphohydrolase
MSARDLVERCWDGVTLRQDCAGPPAAAVLEDLVQAYGEPHRHYHTLDHIGALLDRRGRGAADPDVLRLAILFHDVPDVPEATNQLGRSAFKGLLRRATVNSGSDRP